MKYYSTPEEARDDFSALLDGELTPEDREALEGYVAGESGLLRELDALKRVDAAYRGLPRASAPSRFEDRVRGQLRPRLIRFPRWRFRGSPRMVALVATVLAVAAVGIGSAVMRATLNGRFDAVKVASEKQPEADVRMQAMPAQSGPAPAEEAPVGGRAEGVEVTAAESDSVAAPPFDRSTSSRPRANGAASSAQLERAATLDDAIVSGAAAAPGFQDLDSKAAVPPQAPPAAAFEVAQPNRFDADRPQSSALALEEADAVGMISADAAPSLQAAKEEEAALVTPALEAPGTSFSDERAGNELSRGKDAAESKNDSSQRLFAKTKSAATSPQVLAGREFNVTDSASTEIGYDGEKTVVIERDGENAKTMISQDEFIAELFERAERIVFRHNGVWYEIPAVAPR
ncbi:MAG: hypothetical protein AAB353_03365 [Candidatus Hydrogenedentota bacterium]